jgi:hypothetical protein
MVTGSFPEVEIGRSVTLTPHPLLVPRSKNRVELSLRAFVRVKRVKPEVSVLAIDRFDKYRTKFLEFTRFSTDNGRWRYQDRRLIGVNVVVK